MKNTLLLLACLFLSSTSYSQSILYDYGTDSHIRVEINKPFFKGEGAGFLSLANFLNGHFKIGGSTMLAVELPISRFTSEFGGSSTEIGNLGVAIQFRNPAKANYFELRTGIPTADEAGIFGGSAVGILTDYTERLTAFVPDLLLISGHYFHTSNTGMGGYFRFRPGLDVLIPTNDNGDTELVAQVNLAGGYRNEKLDFAAGITSAIIITEEVDDFADRINRQLFSTLSFTTGNFHPGIVVRVPLGNDVNDAYNLSIGASLNFFLGRNKSGDEE